MTRAIVIIGDREIGNAIADGVTRNLVTLNNGELARLQARDGVRVYGDSVRWESVAGTLAEKYSTRPHGRLYGAVLGVWGLFWTVVYGWYAKLSAWNREP